MNKVNIGAAVIVANTAKPQFILDKDVSSIVAKFLMKEIPYKFTNEITPYINRICLCLVYHPAVKQYMDDKALFKKYINGICHTNIVLNNPYLNKDVVREIAREGYYPPLMAFIQYCPHTDILEEFLEPYKYSSLSSSKNPAILELLERNLRYVDWADLSANPAAIYILERNVHKINKHTICFNPAASHIIDKHIDVSRLSGICLSIIARNQGDTAFLRKYLYLLDFMDLSGNPAAIPILREHVDRIHWTNISSLPEAADILREHVDHIDWDAASSNTAIVDLLAANLDKVNKDKLSQNEAAVSLLVANPDMIVWRKFAVNKAAPIELLRANIDKFYKYLDNIIVKNPNIANLIFEIDTAEYKKRKAALTSFVGDIDITSL